MLRKTVLVVEDEHLLLQNITSILGLYGFNTLKAVNGIEGLQQAINNKPDIIVCDVMMEQMDGFELLSKLQEDVLTQNIPFIFLTARADVIDKKRGIDAGAKAYLTKPFSGKELVSVINQYLVK